ncbi:MAG: amino acid adenylation domain-containing protein [Bacteroidota bacterium]
MKKQLTQSQMLLWMGQQLNPRSPLYNMAFLFDLRGVFDASAFQLAFAKLLEQNDAMRTVFRISDGEPQQLVLEDFSFELLVEDWGSQTITDVALTDWAEQRSAQLLDLEQCCFDSLLIQLSEDRWLWYLNQHHLITDAWSVTVMYKAIMDYYQLAIDGKLDEAPVLPLFGDYVAYEAEQRAKAKTAAHWNTKEVPRALPRLYGFRGLETSSQSVRVPVHMGLERTEQLRALTTAKELRSWTPHATLFNVFVTTLFTYLFRTSGQRRLAIGSPAHNRAKPLFKETPGVFIELFPLGIEIEEGDTFLSLYKKVRTEVNSFLMQGQPGASTAELSRSFGAVLNYIHAGFPVVEGLEMQSHWVHAGHCDPRHHVRMQVYDFDQTGEIQIYFDLNVDVFDETLRDQAPGHYLRILDAFIADRDQFLVTPALTAEAEQEQWLKGFNAAVSTSAPALLVQQFEARVAQHPQRLALRCEEVEFTYEELNSKANQLAACLKAHGLQVGDRLAIHLRRSPELLIAIWGALKAGVAYVPISWDTPASRVRELLSLADCSLLLTSAERAQANFAAQQSLALDREQNWWSDYSNANPEPAAVASDLAYIMFTSGSTGQPKGVMISHGALANYIAYAKDKYTTEQRATFALFTRIGFDLTVTSIFTPLVAGGITVIYPERETGPDLAVLDVMRDNQVDIVKLTPSHLELVRAGDWSHSRIRVMIVGGEDFKASLASAVAATFPSGLQIYNEYGPTEATVGCIVHQFQPVDLRKGSVPIGRPTTNMEAYVLDEQGHLVPMGIIGELYLAGSGLAEGYWQDDERTGERFVPHAFQSQKRMYRTGDLARLNTEGELEFLGRADEQLKIGGIRVEPGEIEAQLANFQGIEGVAVELWDQSPRQGSEEVQHCSKCGLPSNYPDVTYDEHQVCNYCQEFEGYRQRVEKYFRTLDDLQDIFAASQKRKTGAYDCLMLLSGGKDSTYALGQLVEMGYKVLAFTLDNGYISQQALDNVERVAKELGVDCVVGSTPAMNEIFVDSLQRFSNVCNGCFKTIYTLATQVAVEKGIPIIVTGLSRGQFFETRLTEELFRDDRLDPDAIDDIILTARKEYHQVDDAVKRLMDTSIFEDGKVFEQVEFVDFYRYTDVSLQEMYIYLDDRLPWIRPTDTGRSTNCLINKLGIHIHTKLEGHSNYAFPYAWDVRMGHKQRDTAIDEINEPIDLEEVQQMMQEIGYVEPQPATRELVAFYGGEQPQDAASLRAYLAETLPDYMIPTRFQHLPTLPITPNGKIDRKALRTLDLEERAPQTYVAPSTQVEELIAGMWEEVLGMEQVGIHDDFLALGGTSLSAIRLMSRINETLELDLSLGLIFQEPTIAKFSARIEEILEELLSGMDE